MTSHAHTDARLAAADSPAIVRPKHLYKYRSMDPSALKFTRSIVVDAELYFAATTAFNDPFDTLPNCSVESTPEQRAIYYRQLIEEGDLRHELPEVKEAELRARLEATDEERLEAARIAMLSMAEISAVCSLSARSDSVLMWSHYAVNHTGICLRFAVEPGGTFSWAEPVIYQHERPVLNRIRMSLAPGGPDFKAWGRALVTKAQFWAYEEEWRLLSTQGPGAQRFAPRELDGIIFGARAKPEAVEHVVEWVRDRPARIEILQAVPARDTFSLEIVSRGWLDPV